MSEERQNQTQSEIVLAKALNEFAKIQIQQSKDLTEQTQGTHKRIDKLSSKMTELVEVMVRSEERHNSHSDKSERLEKNQIEIGKEFKNYRANNDNRVTDIEKQVLLLENTEQVNKDKSKSATTVRNSVVGTILGAVSLGVLALVFK
jgi:protein subunit release factor B